MPAASTPAPAAVSPLARCGVPEAAWGSSFQSQDAEAVKTKLGVLQVNFNNLSEADIKPSDKVGAAFSCLGTARKYDGSAEAFRKGRAAIQADIWKKLR
ncbi:hypothetical protein GQ600_17385 [Phytophthora cactorum]|nr:hypothetical protein GQ600_17385 [Phytophthora cactorum]